MQIELTKILAADPSAAFAVVADVGRWPQIVRSMRSVEVLTPGPLRAGSRLGVDRVLFGRDGAHDLEVATIEPPHRLCFLVSHPDLHYELDHLIDAVHGGGSRLALIFRTRPATAAGRAAQPMIAPLMGIKLRDELEQDLSDFAAAIARRPS